MRATMEKVLRITKGIGKENAPHITLSNWSQVAEAILGELISEWTDT